MVASGRVEVGIVDEQIASYLIAKHHFDVDIGQVHESVERPLRIHQRHKDKLSAINQAIRKIKSQGIVDGVLKQYLQDR